MPFVSDNNLDETQQNSQTSSQSQQPGQVSGQPQAISGQTGTQSQGQGSNSATEAPQAPSLASGGGSTAASGQGMAAGSSGTSSYNPQTPTSSGQWTNLQNYLNANNGGQFGQQFAGSVGNDVNRAQSSVANAASNFQNAVTGGTVQNNPDVVGEVGTSPQTMSAADQAAFKSQLNGAYGGPQSASGDGGFQRANAEAQSAFDESKAAQTPEGQPALLKKFYQTPNYTAGSQALDTAILSADPNAQAALHSLAMQASDLPVSYQRAATTANSEAAGGLATTNAAREAAQNSLGIDASGNLATVDANGQPLGKDAYGNPIYRGAIGNLENAAQLTASQRTAGTPKFQQDIKNALAKQNLYGLTPEEKAVFAGYTPLFGDTANPTQEVANSYGVDPNKYLTLNAGQYTPATVMSPEDQARLSALYSLAGVNNTFAPDASVAGTAKAPAAFDNAGYQAAVTAAEQYAATHPAQSTPDGKTVIPGGILG